MGQKVNPHIIRLKTIYNWDSRWFNERKYAESVKEDYELRKLLMQKLILSGIAKVEIERSINSIKIIVYVARPGLVIGRSGAGLEEVKKAVNAFFVETKKNTKLLPKLDIRVEAITEPNLNAYLVAKQISDQIEKRLPFKRVLNQTVERVMGAGAKGVRILLAGRIAGAEIARREKIQQGTVPLSTIRANIDYASYPSLTKKGYVGIKVWINNGEDK